MMGGPSAVKQDVVLAHNAVWQLVQFYAAALSAQEQVIREQAQMIVQIRERVRQLEAPTDPRGSVEGPES